MVAHFSGMKQLQWHRIVCTSISLKAKVCEDALPLSYSPTSKRKKEEISLYTPLPIAPLP